MVAKFPVDTFLHLYSPKTAINLKKIDVEIMKITYILSKKIGPIIIFLLLMATQTPTFSACKELSMKT
jgi:hypothetical protein